VKNERILIAYFGRGLGGIQVKILDLLQILSQKEISTSLLIRRREQMFSSPMPKGVRLETLNLNASPLNSLQILLKTALYLNKLRPTQVIIFADHTALIFLILKKLLFWLNFKITISEDIYLSEYLKNQPYGIIRKGLVHHLYPSADKITVLSAKHKSDLVHKFGITPKKIFVYHNWLSPRWQKIKINPLSKRDIDLLFVGRLEKQKQLEVFIDIVNIIIKTKPYIKAVILGDGTQKTKLGNMTKSLGLGHNISFLGYRKDPMSFYNRAKIFLLTSNYEGEPLVFLEAMGSATPIITLPYLGIAPDVIIDGETGYVTKNINDTADRIQQLLDNKEKWNQLSHVSHQYLLKKYNDNLNKALRILIDD